MELRANFKKVFWIRALMNIKVLNIVMSLFLIHRGITLPQVLYLGAVWSVANILFEIPSSYLADRWGRKKTILLGIVFGFLYWLFYLTGDAYVHFIAGTVAYAISVSFFSGTEDAIVYDSAKELGEEAHTFGRLGQSLSARHVIKIVAPIIGVLLARDLVDAQFSMIIGIDIIATIVALVIAWSLKEPNHKMDLEKMEAGVMRDAIKILKRHPDLRTAIFNRVLIFCGFLIVWQYYHVFFVDLGVSLVAIGILWGGMHLVLFTFYSRVHSFIKSHLITRTIDIFNLYIAASLGAFLLFWFLFPQPYVLFILFLIFVTIEGMRLPLFLEFYNKKSASYNRATTLSLASLLKSVIEAPLAVLAGFLITIDIIAPYALALLACLIVIFFFRLTPHKQYGT